MRIDRVKLVCEMMRQDMTQKNWLNWQEFQGQLLVI